jgi:2-oxoglutarate dehydrogenase E2 component (dihydrolipoamide succinyltransferase)
MAEIEVLLPKMGESVAEATVITWLKNEGDSIEEEESLIEIATDKVDSEVPSPAEGVLVKRLFNEGDVVQVGEVIAIISTDGDTPSASPAPAEVSAPAPAAVQKVEESLTAAVEMTKSDSNGRFLSPLVRNIAKTEGIASSELDAISGSGQGGRITKKDILSYLETRTNEGPATAPAAAVKEAPKAAPAAKQSNEGHGIMIKAPTVVANPGDEVIEMDRMRKLIADHMVMSKHVSPHVTSYVEADVTNLVLWRNKIKNDFQKREGEKITFTPILIEALVKTIKDFPLINVSVDGANVIKRKHINVGMATALPSGNLIVPVIKDADYMNLTGITKKVNDLAARARDNKLSPDEIQGGTYTITNVGSFGNVMGTPIINQPQVAIMAVGAIRKVPAVIETPDGDFIGIRHKMYLSHSYDHRVVDGALGGMFVRRMADYLENFDINREI